jgi:hypothetical protein
MNVDNSIISPMLKMKEWKGEDGEEGVGDGERREGGGAGDKGGGGRRERGGAKFRQKHSSSMNYDGHDDGKG